MEELSLHEIGKLPASKDAQESPFAPFGTPITAQEVKDRLSESLYRTLSDDDDAVTLRAVQRAQVYVGSVLSYLGKTLNLDDKVVREIVLMHTIYEMHIALGHEEAGREYRIQAKNMIIAAYGSFPDSDSQQPPAESGGAVITAPRNPRISQLRRARGFTL